MSKTGLSFLFGFLVYGVYIQPLNFTTFANQQSQMLAVRQELSDASFLGAPKSSTQKAGIGVLSPNIHLLLHRHSPHSRSPNCLHRLTGREVHLTHLGQGHLQEAGERHRLLHC